MKKEDRENLIFAICYILLIISLIVITVIGCIWFYYFLMAQVGG